MKTPHPHERRRLVGLLSLVMLQASLGVAAEPTRQELWVPTKNLDTVLKAHPNAVMLSPEQYDALVRDAGKVKPEEDPKTAPPKLIAIEGLRLDGKVEPGAASVTLQGELTLYVPADAWAQTRMAWPKNLELSQVSAEGHVLAFVETPEKNADKPTTEPVQRLNLAAHGPGQCVLHFTAEAPVYDNPLTGERSLDLGHIGCGGSLTLELPPGAEVLPGSAFQQDGTRVTAVFDHRFPRRTANADSIATLPQHLHQTGTTLIDACRLRWAELEDTTGQRIRNSRISPESRMKIHVGPHYVTTVQTFDFETLSEKSYPFRFHYGFIRHLPEIQLIDVRGPQVHSWERKEYRGGLFADVKFLPGSTPQPVTFEMRIDFNLTKPRHVPIPLIRPCVYALVEEFTIEEGVDMVYLQGVHENDGQKRIWTQWADSPLMLLRTSKPRLESDVDVIARIDKNSVRIERKIMLRSDRPVNEIKLTLPAGEEFNAILSKPVGSDQQVSIANAIAMPNTLQQERLITPNIVSQPVFSQSAALTNNAAAVTTGSPFRLTWRRVGQTIAILPAQPLSPTNSLEFSVTSRLKLAKAWKGPRTPESVTIEHLQIPEAVKVAGYTALDFDDAWRVSLTEAKGLEDRDARLTPVKGRMAWFGLREHTLTFDVERAEAVFSTEVTAYALPRARTIEIEGQFTLDISGAPLRSFQVKLPVENAKLLRVTSPLVGEQQLDEATGVWTFTLRQESKGRQNVRWRMSLPASSSGTAETTDKNVPITATLPHLELPQSRRFAGTWVIEANTDTQLSTQMQNMQPLDVLRVPAVAGYQPRHRITSAFTFGAGENALTITARRHAHSELAALVVNRMSLISVLGTDGHSLHEATLDLSHSGEQFVSLHLPKDAELLSTSSGGQAVKPVRGVENAISIPLPAGSANAPHTEVRVQFRQNGAPWNRSGTQNLDPVRIVGNVPVLSTDWFVHAPAAFGYAKVDTTLEQEGEREIEPLRNPVSVLWDVIQPRYVYAMHSPQPAAVSAMANREIARRYARIEDARSAMDRGDRLFTEGDYDAALSSYHAAVNALPNTPETKDWLDLAQLKQADCSVVVARERAKAGKHDEARQLLNQALQLVPGHKAATPFMQQVNDPNRWPQTAAINEMAQVQKGLLLANSSVDIGDYDTALSQYQDVLRVDPYSTAARRGIENAERRKQEYYKSAYDHQRSRMLAEVNEKWDDKMPVKGSAVAFDNGVGRSPGAYLTEKMDKIILPSVQFQGASLEEAIEYLRVKSRDLDTDSNASNRGFSIILRQGDAPSNAQISLDLKDVPMSEALRYVTELAGMKYKVEPHAVLIVPLHEDSSQMYTRTFRVPPDFLAIGGAEFGTPAAPADPFAAAPAAGGTGLLQRRTAKQILEAQGITFPEGASAAYDPKTSTLVVINTQPNLDLVEAFDSGLPLRSSSDDRTADSLKLLPAVDELRFKSGLIPLDVVLPETGRLLRFHGAQAPEVLVLHYSSWSQQIVRAMLALALGLALFWRFGRRRPWLTTLLVVVLASWGAPLLFEGTWLALSNAAAFGWLCAGALRLLGWLFGFIRVKTDGGELRSDSLMSWVRSLRSFVIRHSAFVLLFALSPSLFAEEKAPPADPAAHTVIIPYDATKPLAEQEAERFYLGYAEFQKLWKLAKENRKALSAETDATQHAVIHSALYQGRIEERGLVLEARITATTRGEWTKLLLPFAQIVGGKETAKALVGEVRVDGKAAALSNNLLTLEHPGTHAIELTATLPLARDWNDLSLRLPPALSGMLALRTPKSDGWLRVNETAASTVEELTDARLFTQTLGTHREMRLQRSSRGLERGEGPVPAANVRATFTIRDRFPMMLDAVTEYEFPGAARRTLELAVNMKTGTGTKLDSLTIHTWIPGAGEVRVPIQKIQRRYEHGKLVYTFTLRHEVSHRATVRVTRMVYNSDEQFLPSVYPVAQRVKQDVAVLHDDSMKVQVSGGTAQRLTNDQRGALQDAGRWQWSGAEAPTYEVQRATLFAEAEVGYVFQLSEQKAELLAALTLKRKHGTWTRAVVGLPADYEVQAVQGPALTAWQHEGSKLYLQLNPGIAAAEARVVVHLARVSAQPVNAWTLEPLKLTNYEKIGGKALIVAHAANEVKLPDLATRNELKELDPTVLDSVFAIAPPMEKKRAIQYEGAAWTMDVTLTRQASRFSADGILLVMASDAGIRVSQQVAISVEQGAARQISVRLPASLPEAVVSGPLLRETRSRVEGDERVYDCSFQTEVLDRAELTFDHDLPLTAELDVPFVKVPDAGRLTRWFVLDNASAREAKVASQTALETALRDALPYLPHGLARPQFFRATGDGALKLAYQQLTSTEGNAALVTLADLTTVLRADGSRWDIAKYSLINRSLQFLPVILPDGAELISASVSGEPVRADEETQNGKRVRLIPLIHTRPGQRALEVKMVYRFVKGTGGLKQDTTLDDPELVGLSVERTTWTVWTPKGWKLEDFDGNMTATAEEGRELQQLEGMLSELGEVNRTLASGKLDYGDAEAAYSAATDLAQKVQAKKRQLVTKMGRGSLTLNEPRLEGEKLDQEIQQQGAILKGNWDNNYAGKKQAAKGGKESGQMLQGNTTWGVNGKATPDEQQLRLGGANTFSGAVTMNGGQLFNDNVAVDNSYFGGVTVGTRSGQVAINSNAIDNLLITSGGAMQAGQAMGGDVGASAPAQSGTLTFGGATTVQSGALVANQGTSNITSNARANNLSQTTATQVDVPVNGVLFNRADMQALPGHGGVIPQTRAAPAAPAIAGGWAVQDASRTGNSITFSGTGASNTSSATTAAPAMGSDPFGAPAPPPVLEKPLALPSAAAPFGAPPAAEPSSRPEEAKAEADFEPMEKDGREVNQLGDVVLAQTVESLRPTGRRALEIALPLDGTAHHFSKLKDHAVLEIEIERLSDPRTTGRLMSLVGGLLLWLGAWWWTAKRKGVATHAH